MKKVLIAIVVFLTFTPSISFAAPLTQAQAESLINVVQASPSTPASAFTNLITAFSKITVAQAESLIAIVQTSQGVAANIFVNLLISFTQDNLSTAAPQQTQTTTPPQQLSVITKTQDCTPHLEASVFKIDGTAKTGIDYMFNGTSTIPVGCTLDPYKEIILQTPTVKYIGMNPTTWHTEGSNQIDTWNQGWGEGSGIQPTGAFTWTVGNTSITTQPVESL